MSKDNYSTRNPKNNNRNHQSNKNYEDYSGSTQVPYHGKGKHGHTERVVQVFKPKTQEAQNHENVENLKINGNTENTMKLESFLKSTLEIDPSLSKEVVAPPRPLGSETNGTIKSTQDANKTQPTNGANGNGLESFLKKALVINEDTPGLEFGCFFPSEEDCHFAFGPKVISHVNGTEAKLKMLLKIEEDEKNNSTNLEPLPLLKKNSSFDNDFSKLYQKYPHLRGLQNKVKSYWADITRSVDNDDLEAFSIAYYTQCRIVKDQIDLRVLLLQIFLEQDNVKLVRELLIKDSGLSKDEDIGPLIKNGISKYLKNHQSNNGPKAPMSQKCDFEALKKKLGIDQVVIIDKFELRNNQFLKIDAFDIILKCPRIAIYYAKNPYQGELLSTFQISTGDEVYVLDLIQICRFRNNIEKLIEFLGQLFHSKRSEIVTLNAQEYLHSLVKSLTTQNEFQYRDLVDKKRELCKIIDKVKKTICDIACYSKTDSLKNIARGELGIPEYSEKQRYIDWEARPLLPEQKDFAALEAQVIMKYYCEKIAA